MALPVNMGFQGVRRDTGVIATDLMQQHVARDYAIGRAVKELQNIGFFFGQADLAVIIRHEHLQGRLKCVGPECENCVF